MDRSTRLDKLATRIAQLSKKGLKTIFLLEDGTAFRTYEDPLGYLFQYGVDTPNGRIKAYKRPEDLSHWDPLSLSLLEAVEEGIRRGGYQDTVQRLEYERSHDND